MLLCLTIINTGDEFCNAIIHGELTSDGQPFHTAYANETHPAIISCWIKRLNTSQLPVNHMHNPLLALFLTNYDRLEFFYTQPQRVEDLYVTYNNTSNTDYHIRFEYQIFMFNQSMDHTVAVCGTRYYTGNSDKQCLATTFTSIRYNGVTITSTTPPITTTTETTTTIKTTSTENTTTEETPSDANATTQMCNQTTDESKIPLTTMPVPLEPKTLGYSGPLITGLSLGTSILVLMVVILVLIIGILWVKLRSVSADIKVQRATCTCARNLDQSLMQMNTKVVSDSEEEKNENPSPNPDQ